MNRKNILAITLAVAAVFSFGPIQGEEAMRLTSPAFKNNEIMSSWFTCAGQDVNPELNIEGVPVGAKSLALIVDDPDAPMGTWVHWVVFDIPVVAKISENTAPGRLGINDSGKTAYHGPCPPSGTHRYFFKLYALDALLNLKGGISKKELESAMRGRILAQAELVGLYKRED